MSYPAIDEITTRTQAVAFLRDVLRYVGSHYGGTLAAHLVSIALREVEHAPQREATYEDYATCHEFEIAPDPTVANFDRLLRESYIKHQDTHSRAQDDPGATSTG